MVSTSSAATTRAAFFTRREPGGYGSGSRARLVVAALVALEADIAQQARQQRRVQLLESGLGLVDAPALLAHQRRQLGMHVVPLAQPDRRQEILAQQRHQLALRALCCTCSPYQRHSFQENELRLVVGELGVSGLGRLALLHRTVARILHRQGRGDDQHLGQALLVARSQDHAAMRGSTGSSRLSHRCGSADAPEAASRASSAADCSIAPSSCSR